MLDLFLNHNIHLLLFLQALLLLELSRLRILWLLRLLRFPLHFLPLLNSAASLRSPDLHVDI